MVSVWLYGRACLRLWLCMNMNGCFGCLVAQVWVCNNMCTQYEYFVANDECWMILSMKISESLGICMCQLDKCRTKSIRRGIVIPLVKDYNFVFLIHVSYMQVGGVRVLWRLYCKIELDCNGSRILSSIISCDSLSNNWVFNVYLWDDLPMKKTITVMLRCCYVFDKNWEGGARLVFFNSIHIRRYAYYLWETLVYYKYIYV